MRRRRGIRRGGGRIRRCSILIESVGGHKKWIVGIRIRPSRSYPSLVVHIELSEVQIGRIRLVYAASGRCLSPSGDGNAAVNHWDFIGIVAEHYPVPTDARVGGGEGKGIADIVCPPAQHDGNVLRHPGSNTGLNGKTSFLDRGKWLQNRSRIGIISICSNIIIGRGNR